MLKEITLLSTLKIVLRAFANKFFLFILFQNPYLHNLNQIFMNKIFLLTTFCMGSIIFSQYGFAQSFKKGVILVSLTEGTTYTNYTTQDVSGYGINDGYHTKTGGIRDPLTVEYGLTKRIGLGISLGGDIYDVNANNYSSQTTSISNNSTATIDANIQNTINTNKLKAMSSEITFEFNYHYFITKHLDLAFYMAAGPSGVMLKSDANPDLKYSAGGGIARIGSKARYYFCKRIGAVWMLSAFNGNYTPDNCKNNFGNNVATNLKGIASEVGLTFRFF